MMVMLCVATVTCVSLTGDGQCVLVSTLANCLYLIDKTTGELLNEYVDTMFLFCCDSKMTGELDYLKICKFISYWSLEAVHVKKFLIITGMTN